MFGKVIKGMSVVRAIENLPTNSEDYPSKEVVITKSGVLPVDEPFVVAKDDATD